MDRTLFRVAAILAATFLVILCTDARADTAGGSSDPADGTSSQTVVPDPGSTAPSDSTIDLTETDTAGDGTAGDGSTVDRSGDGTSSNDGTTTSTGTPASSLANDQQLPTAPADPGSSDPPATDPAAAPATEPTAGTEATDITADDTAVPPSATQGEISTAAIVVSNTAPSAQNPATVAPAIFTTPPSAAGARAGAAGDPTSGLDQILPTVERQLRTVQGQIDDMKQRLDRGAAPSKTGVLKLRSSLRHIAPLLLALERRLDAAGELTPRLRRILHRIRAHLSDTRASAADLIAVLRRSGVHGHQLQLLLRELERFQAVHGTLLQSPSLGRLPAPSPVAASQPVAWTRSSSWARHGLASPVDARAAGNPASGTRHSGIPQRQPRSLSNPGAATASSGGAFSVAGMALLATLLIGFAGPRLRGRLTPPPARRRAVVFLAPLERPG